MTRILLTVCVMFIFVSSVFAGNRPCQAPRPPQAPFEVKVVKDEVCDNCECGCEETGKCNCSKTKTVKKATPKKCNLCSAQCTCGCNSGEQCLCASTSIHSVTHSQPVQNPVIYSQPVYQPVYQSQYTPHINYNYSRPMISTGFSRVTNCGSGG